MREEKSVNWCQHFEDNAGDREERAREYVLLVIGVLEKKGVEVPRADWNEYWRKLEAVAREAAALKDTTAVCYIVADPLAELIAHLEGKPAAECIDALRAELEARTRWTGQGEVSPSLYAWAAGLLEESDRQ